MSHDRYQTPFGSRYASPEMQFLFSEDKKFTTWRKLWIALAESEKELGLNITDEQIEELKKYQNDINYDVAQAREKEVRHDVMSHVYAYGQQAPTAKPIIHLGATSCYVGDNTDLIIMYEALELLQKKLVNVMANLAKFAREYKDMPTLGFTHYQPAQLTTVGKRACLWLQELWMDYEQIENILKVKRLRGAKGTTGTQASFMELFEGDETKVKALDRMVAQKMGYDNSYPVTGQTYPRKFDSICLNALGLLAQSCYKFANDLRLLQNLKEMEEPFEKNQIGSSAMAYKRNPMRSERICSLARYVMINELDPAMTASVQWFERTLDDSANKRVAVAESFLAMDGIMQIMINVTSGMVVYPKVIRAHVMSELPFMATEMILMEEVKRGGDRQELHEAVRVHSMAAAAQVKQEGKPNDLLERIIADPTFKMSEEELMSAVKPENFVGRAPSQVEDFLGECIDPILKKHAEDLGLTAQLSV
ncbi:MAG: adenylosuccinate lyase [Lachnospiraceae bacterium]|nr:adenylosuccinate lyase [Lachnospiraceae bacterium]